MAASPLFRWSLIACAILAIQPAVARATLIAYDDFNYAGIGNDLTGNGGGGSLGFSTDWSGQTSYNIGDGSLTSPRDPLPRVGNSVTAVAFGGNRDIDRHLATQLGADNSTLYVGALLQPQGILHQGAYDGWFTVVMRGGTDVYIGMNYSKSAYGLRVADIYGTSNVAAVVGQTVFLVMRIDFTEGVDPVRLYVNPYPGSPEPTTPTVLLINETVQQLDQIGITGPGAVAVDSIRIGSTYLDVAPPISDFNVSGVVNGGDLSVLRDNFGSTTATLAMGDTNGDADVDGGDFLVWQRQNGAIYSPPLVASVPEPASGIFAAFAIVAAYRRRLG